MKCKKAQRLLNMYIDKELPNDSAESIKQHLSGCAGCTNTLNELHKIKKLVGMPISYTPNPFLWTRIREAIKIAAPMPPIGIIVTKILKIWIPIAVTLSIISGLIMFHSPEITKYKYRPKLCAETELIKIPATPENMEKITLNVLLYTNGKIRHPLDINLMY